MVSEPPATTAGTPAVPAAPLNNTQQATPASGTTNNSDDPHLAASVHTFLDDIAMNAEMDDNAAGATNTAKQKSAHDILDCLYLVKDGKAMRSNQ